jgi:hypothetical protein
MSRAWKPLPTHLPGWNGRGRPAEDKFHTRRELKRRKKSLKFKSKGGVRYAPKPALPRTKPSTPFRHTSTCPDQERILYVQDPNTTAYFMSRWRRTRGSWRCLLSDPPFGWFCGVLHPQTAYDYLLRHHFSFHWSKSYPVCAAHTVSSQTEESPAVAYPLKYAGASSDVNTASSLKTPSPTVEATVGLERNGITISSPLNRPASSR